MITILSFIRRYWISLTLFILTLITFLSLRPLEKLPLVPGGDKLHHFIAYAALMFPTALKKPNSWVIIFLFFIGWSGVIELIQPYVNRYGEFRDLAANVGGLICGLLLVQLVKRIVPERLDPGC
jgi:VanZ family protein